MDVAKFKRLPVLGIVRGIEPDLVAPLMETAQAAGLETIEITMNTRAAAELIRKAKEVAGKRLAVGAGTVLSMEALQAALNAGATFIVMPVLVPEVAAYCLKQEIPFFPGALTPQEIWNAWKSGATMVKVFPAGFFGPAYFKEIKGPFNDIELLACAGVTPLNMHEYFANGASAVSFGASVFKREWLAKRDFLSIRSAIEAFILKARAIPNLGG